MNARVFDRQTDSFRLTRPPYMQCCSVVKRHHFRHKTVFFVLCLGIKFNLVEFIIINIHKQYTNME